MCGIYGILELAGAPANPKLLTRMAGKTVHRGPDDEVRHIDGPLVIGMRRLSIIDVGGGHQPLANDEATIWLVANGEIYNYRELRDELIAAGHPFRTASDCETLVALDEAPGGSFLHQVDCTCC